MSLLLNGKDFLSVIKKAAIEAVESQKPTAFITGVVTSIEPLSIQLEQKFSLSSAQLILTSNVTDYEFDMTIEHTTENSSGGSGESAFSSHSHEYKGKKTFTVHKALNVGEEIMLARVQGGQKFVVLDRVGR